MTNPIIQRELIGLLRTRRALLAMVGLAAALAVLVMLRWPADSVVSIQGAQSENVLRVFGYGLMAALVLLAPAFPATTIVRERISGTLALLLNSPMSPWAIFVGKLLGVAGYSLVLVAMSLPAAAACYAMGGIGLLDQLAPMYVVLVLLCLQYATLGLLVSSHAGSTDTALRGTYGLVLVMSVVVLGPYQFLQNFVGGPLITVLEWLRCVSPIPAMMETLGQGQTGSRGLLGAEGIAWRYSLLAVLSIAAFSAATAARLSGWMLDRPRSAGRVTDERSTGARAYRRVMYLWFFDPQRRGQLIGLPLQAVLVTAVAGVGFAALSAYVFVTFQPLELPDILLGVLCAVPALLSFGALFYFVAAANPVTAKEMLSRRFGRGHWMMRLLLGCAVVSLALALFASMTWTTRLTQEEHVAVLGSIIVVLQVALIVLLTPSLAAGLIAAERESRGWQLLQMTPLSAFSIVLGKLLSAAWPMLLVLAATLPGYAVMIIIDESQAWRVVRVLATLCLTALSAVLVSGALSSFFRRTAAATVTAYCALIAVCAGTMLFWLGEGVLFSKQTVAWALRFNPLAAALHLIDSPAFADYRLVPEAWYVIGAASLAALAALAVQTWRLTRPD